jgi:putative glutathione S-transferase
MGMLLNGTWQDHDDIIDNGVYIRPSSSIQEATMATSKTAMQSPGRVWLIASYSCPWSHRSTITHQLKGLSDWIPVHYAYGPRNQGYSINGGQEWRIPGTDKVIRHLHELYRLHDEKFTGQVTVPLLWDSEAGVILSNESSDIVPALDALQGPNSLDFTLRPQAMVDQIDEANNQIYHGLNNAVYRAGFAQTQAAYEEAVETVFQTLDTLEAHLSSHRYYFGNLLTETDVRLFPTLIRFDSIYYIIFKCCRRRVADYPMLFAYTRDLLQLPGVADTVNFDAMRTASFLADTDSPHPIVAIQPDIDWLQEHHRSEFGPTQVSLPDGGLLEWP